MKKREMDRKDPGSVISGALGAMFFISIIAALMWGSYVTYFGLVAKGVRGLDETVTIRVVDKLGERVGNKGQLEQYLILASVQECAGNSFKNERVHKSLGEIAGWHGWREFSDEELQQHVDLLLISCLQKFNNSVAVHNAHIASIR